MTTGEKEGINCSVPADVGLYPFRISQNLEPNFKKAGFLFNVSFHGHCKDESILEMECGQLFWMLLCCPIRTGQMRRFMLSSLCDMTP